MGRSSTVPSHGIDLAGLALPLSGPSVEPSTAGRPQVILPVRGAKDGVARSRHRTAAAILAILDEARGTECALARADALSLAHHCLLGPGHGELRRALADELVGASARTQRRSDLLMGLLWQTVDLVLDADPLAERRLVELSDLLATEDHLAVGYLVH